MLLKGYHTVLIIITMMIALTGCISQDGGEVVKTGTPKEIEADVLIGTDEFLYAMDVSVICLDWNGNTIWKSPFLGSSGLVFLGDSFFATTFDKSETTWGVAFLDLEGRILWQKDIGGLSSIGIGASRELLAAGSSQTKTLWAFSREGEVLWSYNHSSGIDQVTVSPDSSYVVFTDHDDSIHCVHNGELLWSRNVGRVDTGWSRRTIAIAPDSSYLVYGSERGMAKAVVSTLDGTELWSFPINDYVQSVAISDDADSIIVGALDYVYKFTRDGTCVWSANIGGNIDYIALAASADCIAVGSNGLPSTLELLNGNGEVLWRARSIDTIFSVAISPNGQYVAFSNRMGQLFILTNPPALAPNDSYFCIY